MNDQRWAIDLRQSGRYVEFSGDSYQSVGLLRIDCAPHDLRVQVGLLVVGPTNQLMGSRAKEERIVGLAEHSQAFRLGGLPVVDP